VSLPISSTEHEQRLFTCAAATNLPGVLTKMSAASEANLINFLLTGISRMYRISIDCTPRIDRSMPAPSAAPNNIAAVTVGGSNAVNLNSALLRRGMNTITVAAGGWSVNTANISSLIPTLMEKFENLSRNIPVIMYMLDASMFKCSDADGEIHPIVKGADNVFHVVGCLEVAPEVSTRAVMANTIKLINACGGRKIYILTPLPRYLNVPCCGNGEHCTHLGDPDAGIRICCGIHRQVTQLKSQLREYSNCTVVCTGDILAGRENAAPSDVLAATAGWGAVHGPQNAYDKMAAHLQDLISTAASSKRYRDEPVVENADGSQRSRGASFSDGVPTAIRGGAGSGEHQMRSLISYPVPNRGRGRAGTSTSHY